MTAPAPRLSLAPSGAGLRLFEIVGDSYEPALRSHDMVIVAATDRFLYCAEYLMDFGRGESAYRANWLGPNRIHVLRHNPKYRDCAGAMTRDEFNRAVTAIVVAEVKVKDERAIRRAYADRVAA